MSKIRVTRRDALTLLTGAIAASGAVAQAFSQTAITPENLTGVWRGYVNAGGYEIGGEMIFQPNGTFRRMNWYGSLMAWASGPFTIAENWIHFEVDAYGPEIYQGVPQAAPPSETWMVDRFDGRSIDARVGSNAYVHFDRVS